MSRLVLNKNALWKICENLRHLRISFLATEDTERKGEEIFECCFCNCGASDYLFPRSGERSYEFT